MKIRKWMGWMLGLILMLTWSCAGAYNEIPAIYESGVKLLTQTDNVTVTGSADLYLDGAPLKNARGVCIQHGEESYQQITLKGPDNEGEIHENGYAVLETGGTVYVSEMHHGKDHRRTLYNVPGNTILRLNRKTEMLLTLGELAADDLQGMLPGAVHQEETEEGSAISWTAEGNDISPLFQAALNLLWQQGIDRYYWGGYEGMNAYAFAEIEDYGTPTEGIIMTTRKVAMEKMNVRVDLDEYDRISSVMGNMTIRLEAASGEQRELMIAFAVSADQYGESTVLENAYVKERMADALEGRWPGQPESGEEYGMDGEGWDPLPEAELPLAAPPELPDFQGTAVHRSLASDADYIAYAKEIWRLDYLAVGENLEDLKWTVREGDGGRRIVSASAPGAENVLLELETDGEGWIHRIENAGTGAEELTVVYSDTWDEEAWQSFSEKPIWMCLDFMERINPGNREKVAEIRASNEPARGLYNPGFGGFGLAGENCFMLYYTDPIMSEEERIERTKIVVQIYPEVRIAEYNELIDPQEGGNG